MFTQAVKFIHPQLSFAAKYGRRKHGFKLSMFSEKTLAKVTELASKIFASDPSYSQVRFVLTLSDFEFHLLVLIMLYLQFERGDGLNDIVKEVKAKWAIKKT